MKHFNALERSIESDLLLRCFCSHSTKQEVMDFIGIERGRAVTIPPSDLIRLYEVSTKIR